MNYLVVARALTWRYVIALALVATLSTAAWISLHLVIAEQKSTAAIVNVSGRQRMLSQRTALFANLLAHAPKAERPDLRSKLQDAIDLMARSHHGLTHGDPAMELPATMSPSVHALYFDGPAALDRQVETYVRAVQDLLQLDDDKLTPSHPLLQYITDTAPATLVESLDRMVRQYQLEGEASVARLQKAETIFWLVTLLLLMLEAALIFQPFTRHVRAIIGRLQDVTEELRLHQDQLEHLVQKRTADLENRGNELRQQKLLSDDIINSLPGIFYMLDSAGRFMRVNPQFLKVTGYSQDELDRLTATDLFEGNDKNLIAQRMQEVFETGYSWAEAELVIKSGHRIPYYFTGHRINIDGQPGLVGLGTDITERRRSEDALRITASVFDNSQEAILITDAKNNIIDVNPAFTQITGYHRDEVVGRNPKLLSSGRQDSAFYTAMWKSLMQNKSWRGEIWNRRKSGETYAELLSISVICDASGNVQRHVAVFSDISHLKMHEAELSRVAHYDALTGIPNRVLLADRLKQAFAQTLRDGNMLAVCYLDLDGFKPINDTLGHEAGDEVLIEIAKRIEHTIRGGDTVARLGGDEFVVVLLGLERGEECVTTLERLLAAIDQPIVVRGQSLSVSTSIGVSLYPLDDEDPDTLLRHADQAMYVAKQSGKNRFHIYDPALDLRARNQQEFLQDIRTGLEQGQFELYYQPKIELHSRKLVGAEALIRWHHPQRGLLPPSEFLRTIENTELDTEIGDWVIVTALDQLKHWRDNGLDIEISINISAHHLESSRFAEKLQQQLTQHPTIPPGRLQIEVLETAALNDIAIVRGIIESCRRLGVGFALDDFGTGYSSLSYLGSLPVDVLKIDQSFVRDMLQDKGDMAIVQGIIALAHAFGRKTVAEGIESETHYLALLNLGCEIGQGYGIARPMPAGELLNWARQQPIA